MKKDLIIFLVIVALLIGLFAWLSTTNEQNIKVNSKVEIKMEDVNAEDIYIQWILEHSTRCDEDTAAIIVREALKTEMPSLILALIANESGFNPTATNGDAIGLGQIRWKYWGSFLKEKHIVESVRDLYNPAKNVRAINAILTKLIREKGSIERALIAYLGGDKFIGRLAQFFLTLFMEVHDAGKTDA